MSKEKKFSVTNEDFSKLVSATREMLENCTTFKHLTDVHEAYRLYLEDKWAKDKRKPTWYGVEAAYRGHNHE